MLPHYFAKVKSLNFGIWHCTTSHAGNTCFHSTGSLATEQSWPQPCRLGLQHIGHRPAASLSVTGAQHWWTEAVFAACLAWHWSLTMQLQLTSGVGVFLHVYGQKTDTSSNYYEIFSHMTRDVSVFVKCDTISELFFFVNYTKFKLLNCAR